MSPPAVWVRRRLGAALKERGFIWAERTRSDPIRDLLQSLAPRRAELIRVGPEGDGGYLLPDDLEGLVAGFSPGVGYRSGFDLELAGRGIPMFLCDGSVEAPAAQHENLYFDKQFLGCYSDAHTITIDDWVQQRWPDPSGDLILQMDIEGAEFETLLAMSPGLQGRFRIILLEIHMTGTRWLNRPFFELASRALEKLLLTHKVVHLHPNNFAGAVFLDDLELPRMMEITLHRKDRADDCRPATDFPHRLDQDNVPALPTLVLPKCWHGLAESPPGADPRDPQP